MKANAPQSSDLTDLATVEQWLASAGQGFGSGNPDESYLQSLISGISVSIQEYLGHSIQYIQLADWAAGNFLNGALILPSGGANPGGFTYRCTVGGATAGSEPATFAQNFGGTTIDGSVTWTNVGLGVNYTEVQDGAGQAEMILRRFPVYTLGSVEVYGVIQSLAPNDSSDGIVLRIYGTRARGEVYFRGIAIWPFGGAASFVRGRQNVRFNYGLGYWTPGQAVTQNAGTPAEPAAAPSGVPALPYDIKLAATEIVTLRYRQKSRWGDVSVGEGPTRVTYFMKSMTDSAREALDRYKNVSPW